MAQSGGPTAVVNASVAGIIAEALNHDCVEEIYGSLNGVVGLLQEDLVDLAAESQQQIRALKHSPGAALGSCRYKLKKTADLDRVLAEVTRVLRPGGRMLLVMDTPELFERQGRDPAKEDPTNGCVRPLAWWHERAAEAGFVVDEDGAAAMAADPDSFLPLYDWDWLLARKPA